jgi:hypothetical protein
MTTIARSQRKPPRSQGGDASTLRNPHARPRRGSLRPVVETALCMVVDRTAERLDAGLVIRVEEPLSWDNMARWSILYRCRYGTGHAGQELHERDFIGSSRAGVIERLQRRMIGFGVETLEIFAVRGPLTREQVAVVHAANEQLEIERRRLGIYGDGPPRAAAIEKWLKS